MNTVPFDYSLIEKGYKVRTIAGLAVVEVVALKSFEKYPIVAVVNDGLGYCSVFTYRKDGSSPYNDNLVMVPPTEISYHIYYPFKWEGARFKSECLEDAKNHCSSNGIILKIESIDGEVISKTIIN